MHPTKGLVKLASGIYEMLNGPGPTIRLERVIFPDGQTVWYAHKPETIGWKTFTSAPTLGELRLKVRLETFKPLSRR